MREIPLKVFAAWPAPNYVNPVTRGNELLAINIVFIILVTFSIAVRMYSRIRLSKPGWDDAMILLAYVFTIGMTAVVLLANQSYGWDRHIWDVHLDTLQSASIIAFVAKLMFVCASSFTRLSLVLLYYRLIKDTNTWWYAWLIHFGLAFNIAVFIVLIFVGVFECTPVQAYWQFPDIIEGSHCLDEGVITMAAGIMSCVSDLLCTVLPIPIVMRLQMPLRDRIGVVAMLATGVIVTICGIFRTVFIWMSLIAHYDESWYTYPLWICAALEVDLAVICACAPAMKTVLWKPFRKWTGHIYSQYSSNTRYTRNNTMKSGTGMELTSQDPIVDDRHHDNHSQGDSGYQLSVMDFEKRSSDEEQEYEITSKGVVKIPARSNSRAQKSNASPSVSAAPKLEISKKTTFAITEDEGTSEGVSSPTSPAGEGNTARRSAPNALPPMDFSAASSKQW